VLTIVTVTYDFDVPFPVTAALCVIAAYIIGLDVVIRTARSFLR
jgi:hypothetical protein